MTRGKMHSLRSYSLIQVFLVHFFLISHNGVLGQLCTSSGKCDKHERCSVWKEEGECLKNPSYMGEHCPASCEGVEKDALPETGKCEDKHKFCSIWASKGECEENEIDMKEFCAKSCGACDIEDDEDDTDRELLEDEEDDLCKDNHETCAFWAQSGECEVNPNYMTINCAKSCNTCEKLEPILDSESARIKELIEASSKLGVKQTITGNDRSKVADIVQASLHYIEEPQTLHLPKNVLSECQNRNDLCAFWAFIGECEKNPGYMTTNCAPSCKTCNLIDIQNRCPKLVDAEPALTPGSLNKMFSRIVKTAPGNRTDLSDEEKRQLDEDKMPLYTVHVHSGPGVDTDNENTVAMDKSSPPWVITFDDFVTEEECQQMIDLGHKYKYKRSEDVGAVRFDGTHDGIKSERRTSENAWCSEHDGCRQQEVPTLLHERIAKVLNIPANNSEDFQLLRYEKGQFYRTHHDYIEFQVDRQCGPRILTFFLYLNDVEEGGGTNFPKLGLTVMPKRGRAVLWPSVLNSEPMSIDHRTSHQALDVTKGVKFAANGWIHMYDYMKPQKIGCT